MLQLPRGGWRLLACYNGPSPDCIIVVVAAAAGGGVGDVVMLLLLLLLLVVVIVCVVHSVRFRSVCSWVFAQDVVQCLSVSGVFAKATSGVPRQLSHSYPHGSLQASSRATVH